MQECVIQLCTAMSEFDGEWKWQAPGMSYIICTENGKFIVVDGGEHEEDGKRLIAHLKELCPNATPIVDLWIVTHPHLDHYGALLAISRNEELLKQIKISKLCYQLPETPILPSNNTSYQWEHDQMMELTRNLGVSVEIPHTGDVCNIDGISIRFFFTPEDCMERIKNVNELSLIFRVTGKKKSVMFTGDSYERTTRLVAFRFWDDLKSDYCQLAHHGLDGGSAEFYARVDADTVLIPVSHAGERDIATWKPGACGRQFAERLAKKVYKACDGNCTLPL